MDDSSDPREMPTVARKAHTMPASTSAPPFRYPPLPESIDAIRVLTVGPGDFSDPLVGTLEPVAFSDKPHYMALSYAWRDPMLDTLPVPPAGTHAAVRAATATAPGGSADGGPSSGKPDATPAALGPSTWVKDGPIGRASAREKAGANAKAAAPLPALPSIRHELPIITLNGQAFPVRHNLYLAILHVRSLLHPISLWVDAVCINQADTAERDSQVALMSFIYTRALRVVVWLGVREYSGQADQFRRLGAAWKAGQSRLLADSLADGGATRLRYSAEPDAATAAGVAESGYWTRLWIVQEVCLSRDVLFVYGPVLWRYEDLRKWQMLERGGLKPPAKGTGTLADDGVAAIIRLIKAREARHSDKLRLERLIEQFSSNKCSEVRDRVYGLLGLASDAYASYGGAGMVAEPSDEYLHSLELSTGRLPELQRGSGHFTVRYSCSLYDLWAAVVKFVYFRAGHVEVHDWWSGKAGTDTMELAQRERQVSVVRIAGALQVALDQRVEEEVAARALDKWCEKPIIRACGYVSGKILHLGPSYSSWVGSFQAYQDWLNCWEHYYTRQVDLKRLRRVHERYSDKIMAFEERDVRRVHVIQNRGVVAWRLRGSRYDDVPAAYDDSPYLTAHKEAHRTTINDAPPGEPRLFLGTAHSLGLVPAAAKVGDYIIRFWNCDAAIVVRMVPSGRHGFMLLGRADVAETLDRSVAPGFDLHGELGLTGRNAFNEPTEETGAVCIDFDLPTLQIITASIVT